MQIKSCLLFFRIVVTLHCFPELPYQSYSPRSGNYGFVPLSLCWFEHPEQLDNTGSESTESN